MGRPPGRVQDRPFQMRVSEDFLETIDKWRANQDDVPARAEAIRRLVEIGLGNPIPSSKAPHILSTAKQGAARAAELAGKTIDKHQDPAASMEERKVRKRKLVEGPSAFRNTRKDAPSK
jgi:hypothetical protein